MTRCAGYERHLGLRYFIASSPQTTGRIVFVNLRTGNSLSVALHLPSQERSYFQLMGPNQTHEGTCTLLFRRLRRRTKTDFPVRLNNRARTSVPCVLHLGNVPISPHAIPTQDLLA
jgi:hypothetical protein